MTTAAYKQLMAATPRDRLDLFLRTADPDGQTLLVWYPEVEPRDETYVQPAVRIEAGAKSALDPHRSVSGSGPPRPD